MDHADVFADAFEAWVSGREGGLAEAIDQSARHFRRMDIQHMLRQLQGRVTADALRDWLQKTAAAPSLSSQKTVLCLHAGNLPMVGFQDVAAVWLSGHRYLGKLSKKDPFLLDSFLRVLSSRDPEGRLRWSTDLDSLGGKGPADMVLFAGSEATARRIRGAVSEAGLSADATEFVMRTASFSVAWMQNATPRDYADLAEAILRYDGNGCRSVKAVVSDVPLFSEACGLTDAMEAWWTRQPSYRPPSERTRFDVAALHAAERPYLLLEHVLIEPGAEMNPNPNRVLWLQGGEAEVRALIGRYDAKVQNVYVAGELEEGMRVAGRETEGLWRAQDPAVDWKPDNIDILNLLSPLTPSPPARAIEM